jgi:hypothetical protein
VNLNSTPPVQHPNHELCHRTDDATQHRESQQHSSSEEFRSKTNRAPAPGLNGLPQIEPVELKVDGGASTGPSCEGGQPIHRMEESVVRAAWVGEVRLPWHRVQEGEKGAGSGSVWKVRGVGVGGGGGGGLRSARAVGGGGQWRTQ